MRKKRNKAHWATRKQVAVTATICALVFVAATIGLVYIAKVAQSYQIEYM